MPRNPNLERTFVARSSWRYLIAIGAVLLVVQGLRTAAANGVPLRWQHPDRDGELRLDARIRVADENMAPPTLNAL
jgi:hypothetical protein